MTQPADTFMAFVSPHAYYELVFAQARVAAAYQSLRQAQEFLRVSRLRELAGAAGRV